MVNSLGQKTYELWVDEDGSYDFFPSTNASARALLDDDARLVKKFEADTWELAQQKRYDYLKWGQYHPYQQSYQEGVCITDSKGRQTKLQINKIFSKKEASEITKISFKEMSFLEKNKIVVPDRDFKNNKSYYLPQILQLQAYVLIGKDKNVIVNVKPNVIKKVLNFYSNNFKVFSVYLTFRYSIGANVKILEKDLSNKDELLEQIKQFDFVHKNVYQIYIYPSLLNIIEALHKNIQLKYNIDFDEFKHILAA
jgi:hypothetical protein